MFAGSTTVKIEGMDQLRDLINGLPVNHRHAIIGSALYQSVDPFISAARKNINKKTGNLEESIGKKRMPLLKSAQVGEVRVGPRLGGGHKGYHGWLVEKGHRIVKFGTLPSPNTGRVRKSKIPGRTGKGMLFGEVREKPFLAPAFSQASGEVYQLFRQKIGKVQVDYFKRWAKKGLI